MRRIVKKTNNFALKINKKDITMLDTQHGTEICLRIQAEKQICSVQKVQDFIVC